MIPYIALGVGVLALALIVLRLRNEPVNRAYLRSRPILLPFSILAILAASVFAVASAKTGAVLAGAAGIGFAIGFLAVLLRR